MLNESFMNLYNILQKISFLVIASTLTSDNQRWKATQCNINKENVKVSAVSSGKTDKYEYVIGKDV